MHVTRLPLILRIACTLAGMGSAAAHAQIQQFPYEAVVQADDVYVRSGPGKNYYPTGKVALNQRVTVHRHDPGGWYMIAPPPGSFSWIDASLVQKTGPEEGVIQVAPLAGGQPARAIVRIGSEFGDDHSIYSRELRNGDTVRVIGRAGSAAGQRVRTDVQDCAPGAGVPLGQRRLHCRREQRSPAAAGSRPVRDPLVDATSRAADRADARPRPIRWSAICCGDRTVSATSPASATLNQLDQQYSAMMGARSVGLETERIGSRVPRHSADCGRPNRSGDRGTAAGD